MKRSKVSMIIALVAIGILWIIYCPTTESGLLSTAQFADWLPPEEVCTDTSGDAGTRKASTRLRLGALEILVSAG